MQRLSTSELKELARDLTGKSFAFFGEFAFWPCYHWGGPEDTVRKRSATIRDTVDENLDFLVLGDRRGQGRSEAKKKTETLQNQAMKAEKKGQVLSCPQIIDESVFREMFRIDLTGRTFALFGGFDCCGGELDEALLTRMIEAFGASVAKQIDHDLDYLVLGNRRGPGKIKAVNEGQRLQSCGAKLKILNEQGFLEMVRTDEPLRSQFHGSINGGMDFPAFLSRLHGTVDYGKLGRAMKILKSESFKLYVHRDDERLVGVVRSQSGGGTVYSSWLTKEGKYGCSTPALDDCMGLHGSACKHLLVLLVGLTRAGDMDAETAYSWIHAAQGKRPRTDNELAAHTFLQFKDAEAGEIDWRPTETIPEDYTNKVCTPDSRKAELYRLCFWQ